MLNIEINGLKKNCSLRLAITTVLVLLPIIFLWVGIHGSFLFTFSVPIIWQICILGKPLDSLGLTKNFSIFSLITGIVTGIILGILGGYILVLLGITGYTLTDMHRLQFAFGSFDLNFSLQKEAGYYLLTKSDTFKGGLLYLSFSIGVIGLGEELFWRGFIQAKIAHRLPKNAAVWLTAGLFALVHFYIFLIVPFKQGIFFLGLITIAGVIWGYLFDFFRNIWSIAISHGVAAFIIWKDYFFA